MPSQPLIVRQLGRQDYGPIFAAMQDHVSARKAARDAGDTWPHELWLLEHAPVFTQGRAGKPEHLLAPGDIPVIQTDRGGQVTYHGPGQLMSYCLFDLQALGIGVASLVHGVEAAIIAALADWQITAAADPDAPGVYLESGAKIASIGLRVTHALSYHGVALNVDMALEPFSRINPCGYQGLAMAQIKDHAAGPHSPPTVDAAADQVLAALCKQFDLTVDSVTQQLPTTL